MMAERDQFSAGVNPGIYGSGEPVGNIVFPQSLLGGRPSAPQNLIASNSDYTNKVLITWTKVQNVIGYKIFRDSDLLVETTGIVLQTLDTDGNTNTDTNTLYYEDTTAIPGVLYSYSALATNATGDGSLSNSDTGSRKLSAPVITATQNLYKDKIELSLNSTNNSSLFVIYYSQTPDYNFAEILTETAETTFLHENLLPNTIYYYTVQVKTDVDECSSEFSNFAQGTTSSILDTPTLTTVSNVDHVYLSWNSIEYASMYKIYRDGILLNSTNTLEYFDTTGNPGVSYVYFIVAKDQSTNSQSLYDTDGGTIGFKKLNIVGNGLIASNGLHENKITLNWNGISGATGYKLYRGNTWVNPLNNMTLIATVGNVFSYNDTNTDLSYNNNYYYSIRATSTVADAISDYSTLEVLGRLKTPIPSTPTGLSATDGTHVDKISLSWNSVPTASFYKIYRDGVFVDTSSTNSYDDTSSSVTPATQYTYSISAVNSFGEESSNSSTNTGYRKLTAPILTSASDSFFETKIVVVWNGSVGATSYRIYRGTTPNTASMSLIATVNSSTFTYDDTYTDLTVGTTYHYAVKAVSALSTSDFSNVDSGTLLPATNITVDGIIAPTSLTATTAGSSSVTLNWSYTGDSTSFRVWRNGTPLQTVSDSLRTFTDTTATPGSNISYQISTTNRSGVDLFSNTSTGSIKLAKPSITVSGGVSTTAINVSWASISGATNYTVERSIDNVTYSTIASLSAPTTTYSDTNTDLFYNINYFYRVKATCSITALNSDFSNVKYGYLLPPVPSAFTVSASDGTDSSAVNLSWTASENAYSYRILRNSIPIAFSRSNLLIKSQDPAGNISGSYPPVGYGNYGNTTKTSSTTTQTLPIGGSGNATTITFSGTGDSNSGIYQNIPAVEENAWYILSVYAKGSGTFRMSYYNGTTSQFSDITNGTSIRATETRTVEDTNTTKDFALTSNWQRYSFVFRTTVQADTDANIRRIKNYQSNVAIGNGSNNTTPTITLWGVQLEKVLTDTDVAGTYIPTTNFPVIQTTFSDSLATDYTNHTYQIVANNIAGSTNSTNTNSGFKKPLTPVVSIQPTRTDISTITIKFDNCGNSNSTFYIYRGIDQNTNNDTDGDLLWSLINTQSGQSSISYTDNSVSLNQGAKYYYKSKVEFNGVSSDFSNLSDYGTISGLSAPTGPQDYEVFAIHFYSGGSANTNTLGSFSRGMFDQTLSTQNKIAVWDGTNFVYNSNFAFKAIVPNMTIPSPPNAFGGTYRNPAITTYSPSTNTQWENFVRAGKSLPINRRVLNLGPWWVDCNPFVFATIDPYRNTTDGTTFCSDPSNTATCKKYLTPWLENNSNEAGNIFSQFLNKCKTSNFVFSWVIDDRENINYFYLNGANNGRAFTSAGGTRSKATIAKSWSPIQEDTDSRLIQAIINDTRFTTLKNPITNKTFAEEFMDNFNEILAADPLYNGSDRLVTLPNLTWQDLLLTTFTNTSRELLESPTSGNIAPAFAAVGAACNYDFRTQPYNYWTIYGPGTNECEGPNKTAVVYIPDGATAGCNVCGSRLPTGKIGSENARKSFGFKSMGIAGFKPWNGTSGTCTASDTWPGDSQILNWFTQDSNKGDKITGYMLVNMVVPAWNATIDSWVFNYYSQKIFASLYNTNNIEYNNVKYMEYEWESINANEAVYTVSNYADKTFRKNLDQIAGPPIYGYLPSSLYPDGPRSTFTTSSSSPTPGSPGSNNMNNFIFAHDSRTGYVKKPTSGSDTRSEYEKYAWAGDGGPVYGGSSNNIPNSLVRYPDTRIFDTSGNWLASDNSVNQKFRHELVFKLVINYVKQMRHCIRSKPTQFTPWFSVGPSNSEIGDVESFFASFRGNSMGYFYDLLFHGIMHTASGAINIFSGSGYNPSGEMIVHQNALDEWRNVSYNSKPRPCTNSTCNPDIVSDRLDLSDCFEKYLISGCKLNDGSYLWRLTVPPKYFDPITKKATLNLTNSATDSDLPQTIIIDSNLDVFNLNNKNTMRSRGIWIKRNIARKPDYTPVLP